MLVLTGAGLLVRTLANLNAENVGLDPRSYLLVFRVDATYSNRTSWNLQTLYRDLQEQFFIFAGRNPGQSLWSPTAERWGYGRPYFLPRDQSGAEIHVNILPVAGNFFETMRVPLLEG